MNTMDFVFNIKSTSIETCVRKMRVQKTGKYNKGNVPF